MESADFQVPIGFTENDVNVNAPSLFSVQFLLFYSYIMTIHGLTAYSLAIKNIERQDLQVIFLNVHMHLRKLFQKIVELAKKKKPKFTSVPSIPSPHVAKFMESTGIISNLVGEKIPLNCSKISTLFFNSTKTGFVSSLSLAFSQMAESEDVRNFMVKNVKLAGKDAESFDDILHRPIYQYLINGC